MIPAIISGLVCLVLGIAIGFLYRKNVAEKEIGSAEEEATRIVNVAIKEAESKKREALAEAREEIHKRSRNSAPSCRSRSAAFSPRRTIWTARPTRSRRRRSGSRISWPLPTVPAKKPKL